MFGSSLPLGQCRCENCYQVVDECDAYSVELRDSIDGSFLLNDQITLCEPCVYFKKDELATMPVTVVVRHFSEATPIPQKG